MPDAPLLSPLALGELSLANRIVMAPMTRNRALAGDLPGPLAVEYYGARASAGLIITEGTWPVPDGKGYARTPGIGSSAQAQGWRQVSEAVHGAGGRIVMQLMHCGRIGSHLNKAPGTRTLAPSAIRAAGRIFTDAAGLVDFDVPEALTLREVADAIEAFAAAARAARAAGFDGVELHAASGYLPMQFLSTGTNRRTDAYGGSLFGRLRFVIETIEALVAACGSGRVGIRICPGNTFNDLHDADPRATYGALLQALSPLGLAYLHVVRSPDPALDAFGLAAEHYRGARILNDGFDFESGNTAVRSGAADAISYARAFIANPDFVERSREGWPLASFDRRTLYTPGPEGYTSYPAYRAGS
ncbi:MAG: alkene reductase [Proteobacteria bacterium]|nr:alkene reductase [Pseudomonadota bacterium]